MLISTDAEIEANADPRLLARILGELEAESIEEDSSKGSVCKRIRTN